MRATGDVAEHLHRRPAERLHRASAASDSVQGVQTELTPSEQVGALHGVLCVVQRALGLIPGAAGQGFTQPVPSIVFLVALAASMLGLSHAVRTIPLGTAYAVWVGIGAALTVAWGVVSGTESSSWAKVLLIAGLVACVIGLKLVGETH